MKTSSLFRVAVLGLGLGSAVVAADSSVPVSASDLAARLSALQQDGTSYVRLRLEIKEGNESKGSFQLQIKQRRSASGTDIIYQVLFPRERKGESVLLHQAPGHAASGAVFVPPDKTQTLDSSKMKEALFGSDLAYGDIVENFFAWSQQAIVGTEVVNGTTCQILESKPGKGDSSAYRSVKSWIDVGHMVPLRVDKFGASGQQIRRIDTTNVESDDKGRALPAGLVIRRPGSNTSTIVEGSKIKHDAVYTDADFSPQGIQDLKPPRYGP